MAAVVALATVAGALGGALATAGVMHFAGGSLGDIEQSAFSKPPSPGSTPTSWP